MIGNFQLLPAYGGANITQERGNSLNGCSRLKQFRHPATRFSELDLLNLVKAKSGNGVLNTRCNSLAKPTLRWVLLFWG